MRYITTALITAALTFSPLTSQANAFSDALPEGIQPYSYLQSHLFDGIQFTELQRQQMRDLMQQTQQSEPVVSIDDIQALHKLVIADPFDEIAVQTLIEKIGQRQIARQIAMTRVRNRMYHLLTPEQQAAVEQQYQQRMAEYQQNTHKH